MMGVGKLDDTKDATNQCGLLLTLREGDVIVHPAGTRHSNVTEADNYRFVAFFPQVHDLLPPLPPELESIC